MKESEIEVLAVGDNLHVAAQILHRFLQNNENVFAFPNLCFKNLRVLLWTALFQHLQKKQSEPIHALCLAAIRILSRDKTELENMICEKWVTILIDKAGLYVDAVEEAELPAQLPEKYIAVEALKCLCNVTFNSEVARALCAHTAVAQGLIARLQMYNKIPFKVDIMLFDLKLLFILTALRHDIKVNIKDDLLGMDHLTNCLKDILNEASSGSGHSVSSSGLLERGRYCFLHDHQQAVAREILKTQFNLLMHSSTEDSEVISQADDVMYSRLMSVLVALMYARTSDEEKLMDLHSNIANLLTSVPSMFFSYLTPELKEGETSQYMYDGMNMDALQSLVQVLQYRFTLTSGNQYENLSPILTTLIKSSRGCRAQRKYLRLAVLPPLRDVSRPPERGSALRNQLCRLLTSHLTPLRDLVAEFLFILCKEKVSRMVKYTGFGNAAGHLAQKGLLAGGGGGEGGGGGGARAQYSSSEESDTEEYAAAAAHIDPVVGCTRPPRPDPFHGMSEDQKEYEAMKLVNLFDKMMSEGVMKPARVGPDGCPQAIEHVLELRDQPPNRPQS